MLLSATNGNRLALTVLGYQFPLITHELHDANWLTVRMDAALNGRAWSKSDPCLLTWEANHLARWLSGLANYGHLEPELEFTEPNLSFKYVMAEPDRPTLRVHFEAECRPPWATPETVEWGLVWMDLPLAEIDLDSAAASLYEQLQRFPQRGA